MILLAWGQCPTCRGRGRVYQKINSGFWGFRKSKALVECTTCGGIGKIRLSIDKQGQGNKLKEVEE